MFSKYELLYLIKILDYYEQGLVRIIEYYINTYTFEYNTELKQTVDIWCNDNTRTKCELQYGLIEYWGCFKITDMHSLFDNKLRFQANISRWDVSNVTNMSCMFNHTYNFNQPLNNWNVSNVTNMFRMFNYSVYFNKPLDSWDVVNVTNMDGMFYFRNKINKYHKLNRYLNDWK